MYEAYEQYINTYDRRTCVIQKQTTVTILNYAAQQNNSSQLTHTVISRTFTLQSTLRNLCIRKIVDHLTRKYLYYIESTANCPCNGRFAKLLRPESFPIHYNHQIHEDKCLICERFESSKSCHTFLLNLPKCLLEDIYKALYIQSIAHDYLDDEQKWNHILDHHGCILHNYQYYHDLPYEYSTHFKVSIIDNTIIKHGQTNTILPLTINFQTNFVREHDSDCTECTVQAYESSMEEEEWE